MKKTFNWGILGPGRIARRFSEGLQQLDDAVLYAVGSRSEARAREFAEQYGYKKYYGSYKELVSDPDLDIVYIASPHSHHAEHTILSLEGGKSVICEKAFAINTNEVKRMIDLARTRDLFLMEALWPPFQPSYKLAHKELSSGIYGEIVSVRSYFAFRPPYEPEKRLYNPALGGGALLDIGIYPVIDAITFLGIPDNIETELTFDKTGVDDNIDILFGYKNGKSASLYASLKSGAGVGTDLFCENGVISLRRMRNGSQQTLINLEGRDQQVFTFNPPSRGFHLEAREAMDCIASGDTESKVVPLSFSLELIGTLDRIRELSGIIYKDRE